MSASLLLLPPELGDRVAAFLDPSDICRLRLACRRTEAFVAAAFRRLFYTRRTNLSRESLAALTEVANHPDLGPAVRCVRVTVLVLNDGLHWISDIVRNHGAVASQGDVVANEVPAKCVEGFQQRAQTGYHHQELCAALRSLANIQNVVVDNALFEKPGVGGSKVYAVQQSQFEGVRAWLTAGHGFDVTMTALAQSQSVVSSLDYYWDVDLMSFFLPQLDVTMTKIGAAGMRSAFGKLRSLALSVSTRPRPGSQRARFRGRAAGEQLPNLEFGEKEYASLANLLEFTPELEVLKLHLYSFDGQDPDYEPVLANIAARIQLPRLRTLCLHGFPATQSALVQLLKTHPQLHHLELKGIRLVRDSTWPPVFEQISAMRGSLRKVVFEQLNTPRVAADYAPDVPSLRPDGPDNILYFPSAAPRLDRWNVAFDAADLEDIQCEVVNRHTEMAMEPVSMRIMMARRRFG